MARFKESPADLRGPEEVTIIAGETIGKLWLFSIDDGVNEETESFTFSLGDISGLPNSEKGTYATHTVKLLDNDPLVSVAAGSSISESNTTVKFSISLSSPSNRDVVVPFSVYGTAKEGVDYKKIQGDLTSKERYKVTIPAGETTAFVEVDVLEDDINEVDETVGIRLEGSSNGHNLRNAILDPNKSRISDSFRINNDDGEPRVNISSVSSQPYSPGDYSSSSKWVPEGGSFKVNLSLSRKASKSMYVPISFPTGTGRASFSDFVTDRLNQGRLKIPAGSTSATFFIHTENDSDYEPDEKIRITMGQPVDSDGQTFGSLPSTNYEYVGIYASDTNTTISPGALVIGTVGTYPSADSSDSNSELVPEDGTVPISGTGSLAIISSGLREGQRSLSMEISTVSEIVWIWMAMATTSRTTSSRS